MKLIIPLLFTLLLSSCANYINSMHKDIDSELYSDNPYKKKRRSANKKFAFYREGEKRVKSRLKRSSAIRSVAPSIKRQYSRNAKKRFTADDLVDNSTEGSLWSGRGQDNFLFSNNRIKKQGDIVALSVQKKLKDEITLELKKAFPPPKKKKDKKKEGEAAGAEPEAAGAGGADQEAEGSGDKVYDKISGIIIEEINKDHLLVKGRKDVLYQAKKRTIEVEALVARRDIADDDTVNSDTVLESSIMVVR